MLQAPALNWSLVASVGILPATAGRRPSRAEDEFLTHLAAPDQPPANMSLIHRQKHLFNEEYRNELCIHYRVGLIELAKEFGLA
ncbi:MAG: hypothetical protein KDC00_14865 [Flavobacteriales bacterium]|nr:hypothetical protein [Flavobacteriales bacterium]